MITYFSVLFSGDLSVSCLANYRIDLIVFLFFLFCLPYYLSFWSTFLGDFLIHTHSHMYTYVDIYVYIHICHMRVHIIFKCNISFLFFCYSIMLLFHGCSFYSLQDVSSSSFKVLSYSLHCLCFPWVFCILCVLLWFVYLNF